MNAAKEHMSRLVGWKAIGQFLRCTERTARRWEADRAMPVHRMPGGGRSLVWAHAEELTAWLSALPSDARAEVSKEAGLAAAGPIIFPGGEAATAAEPVPPLPSAPASRLYLWRRLIAAALVGILALAVVMILRSAGHVRHGTAPDAYLDNPKAREIFVAARFELTTRTAESLVAAERDFRRVIELEPRQAAGWSGLADTYLLLREFGSLGDEVAYPKASQAAHQAIELDPDLADAWLDEGFVAFWWQGDAAAAFHDFETALKLEPSSAKAFHWYSTALLTHGDFAKSLDMIARARALDPNSRAIVADEAWMKFIAGQRVEGLAALERMVRLDPSFAAWHHYLSRAYLVLGRDEDFLREAMTAAELRGNTDAMARLRLAQQQFLAGGRPAMLEQLGASEQQALDKGTGSALQVALYRALARDEAGLFHWLAIAEESRDHNLPRLRADPEFADYRDTPRFQAILQRLP